MKIQQIRKNTFFRKKPFSYILLAILPFAAAAGLICVKDLYAAYCVPHMPPCFIRSLTGWKCMSCGMTHAVYAICRGDFSEAMRQNAVSIALLVLALAFYAELWCRAVGKPKKIIPRSSKFWLAALGIWVLYTVLRNVI